MSDPLKVPMACAFGIHARVGAKCWVCGEPAFPADEHTLRFVVTFHGDARVRWRDGREHIARGLLTMASTFARCYSQGALPQVTVENFPGEAVPAASGESFKSGGACVPALPATDPASPGSVREKLEAILRFVETGTAAHVGNDNLPFAIVLARVTLELRKIVALLPEAKP